MKYIELATGENIPLIGQGCMGIGGEFNVDASNDKEHKRALEFGIDLGMTLIDTAEVYANGHSENLVGQVAKGKRDKLFIATKFSPENHGFNDVITAAERSLRRLNTDYIDLYQIHWPNPSIPLSETIEALVKLTASGKVRHIGVSNFSSIEMSEAEKLLGPNKLFSNQVEYNLFDRFIEQSILPHCHRSNTIAIAYSPLDKGRTTDGDSRRQLLNDLATKYQREPSQIALNWLTMQGTVVAIPKSTNLKHIRHNAESLDFALESDDLEMIDRICKSEPEWVHPDRIRVSVAGEGNRKVYQTLSEAIENKLNMSPSPLELAENIRAGEPTKPVRLLPSKSTDGMYQYDLIEGRLRYWAWVIAYNGTKPVPAYIRSI